MQLSVNSNSGIMMQMRNQQEMMCELKHSKVLCEGEGSTMQGEILHIAVGGEIKMWTRFIVEINFKYCLG